MPDTFARRVEQLATWYRQPAALNFTFGMGLVVRDIPNNPDNEVKNDIGTPIFEVVDAQDME